VLASFRQVFGPLVTLAKYKELIEYVKKFLVYDTSYAGSVVDDKNVNLIFKLDFFRFLNDFIMDTWKVLRLDLEEILNKKMKDSNMTLPETIDKDTFKDVVGLWN